MLKKQYKTYKYNADAKSYDVVTTSSLASVTEWRATRRLRQHSCL